MQQHHTTTHTLSQVIVRSVLFLIAYVLSGIVALQLIVPPGFASVLWLPGGLALGFILLWGMRYLPVVAVGAFILNLYITWFHIDTKAVLQYKVWILDILLVIAPMLQVLIAWALIRLFMDLRKPFNKTLNIILFAIFSGPAASLVSATFYTSCLAFFNLIHQDAFFLNWFALWVGESIGVLIVTPIMMMLFNSSKANRKQVCLFFVLPLMLICLSIISVFLLVNQYEYHRVQGVFQAMSENKAQDIEKHYIQDLNISENLGYYIQTHGEERKDLLRQYVVNALSKTSDMISVGWLNQASMATLIKQMDAGAMNSERYTPIYAILPKMMGDEKRHLGLIRVKSSTIGSISKMYAYSLKHGKSQLVFIDCDLHAHMDIGLLVVPIIHNQKLVGSVFALLNFYDDFQQLFADKAPYNQISISYHNLNYHHYNPVLYAYKDHKASMLHESFQIKYIRELWVSKTQHFDVELFSSEWFIKHHYSWLVWSMIVGGLFFCIVMEILLLIVYGQKEIIQTKVDMQAALLEKEEKTNLLLLQSAGEGILGVDHKGMITFANPAMVQLLGYPSNALVNQHINQLNILVSNDKGQPVIEKQGSCLVEMNTKANRVACKIQKRQGDWIWVEVMNTLVSDNDANGHVVLLNDITEKKEAGDKLEKMAHYDQLTGLPNRTSFLTYLEQAIKRAERSSENIAVCFLDMDNFKYINDHWGHQLGDEVLKKIPILLAPFQRESDYLARLSGDEFGLVLHDITSADMATTAVKRYLNAFNESLCIEKNEIKITFSVGVAIYPTGGSTAEELIKNADIAMYKAKDRGKNTYAFFNQEASKQIQRYHLINDAFAHALTHHEFYLLYQPQIDVKTNELYGVEALIRWKHPKLGEIMPSEFILVAENTGVIKEIGRWLLKQIAKDYQQLISINKDLKISVNVSIKQLEDKEFELHVHDFMEQHVKPENITIEVTETALMHNFKMISALMFRLSQLGIGFALDDFGMEYSSLNYLKNLDINCIKIDKNFVRDMCDNNVSAAIVQAIIKLANALDVTSIAEGVETQSQYNFLAENACDYIQGYYFSKPIALNELIDKYH